MRNSSTVNWEISLAFSELKTLMSKGDWKGKFEEAVWVSISCIEAMTDAFVVRCISDNASRM